jgi:early secretory antigenic target protein ESAT-6
MTQGAHSVGNGEINVHFEHIEDAALRVRGTSQAIDTLLDDLQKTVAPLVAGWTGEAAAGYQYQHHKWLTAAQDLHRVLNSIAQVLENSHSSYTQAESDVNALWTG